MSLGLYRDVLFSMHRDLINLVPFLCRADKIFIIYFLERVKNVFVMHDDAITNQGGIANSMYIITNGSVHGTVQYILYAYTISPSLLYRDSAVYYTHTLYRPPCCTGTVQCILYSYTNRPPCCTVYKSGNQGCYLALTNGAFFGEIGCILQTRRTTNIIADRNCELVEISKEDLQNVMMVFPDFGLGLRAVAYSRFRATLLDQKEANIYEAAAKRVQKKYRRSRYRRVKLAECPDSGNVVTKLATLTSFVIEDEVQERDGLDEEARKAEAEYMKSRWSMARKHASTRERARRYNQRYSKASSFFSTSTLQLLDGEEKQSVLDDHGETLEEEAQPSSNANATQVAQAAQVDAQRLQQETQRRLEDVEVKVKAMDDKLDRLLAHLKAPEM
jgi:CRP-like cAMP-binding protein